MDSGAVDWAPGAWGEAQKVTIVIARVDVTEDTLERTEVGGAGGGTP